jgi:hypothetical protein
MFWATTGEVRSIWDSIPRHSQYNRASVIVRIAVSYSPLVMVVPTRIIFPLSVVALFIVIFIALHPSTRDTICAISNSIPHSATTRPHSDYSRRLHLLLPVNAGAAGQSSAFCKTLLSAVVHGYSPIVLNWDVEGDYDFMQRLKVTGM